jgi:hypothetical protein
MENKLLSENCNEKVKILESKFENSIIPLIVATLVILALLFKLNVMDQDNISYQEIRSFYGENG